MPLLRPDRPPFPRLLGWRVPLAASEANGVNGPPAAPPAPRRGWKLRCPSVPLARFSAAFARLPLSLAGLRRSGATWLFGVRPVQSAAARFAPKAARVSASMWQRVWQQVSFAFAPQGFRRVSLPGFWLFPRQTHNPLPFLFLLRLRGFRILPRLRGIQKPHRRCGIQKSLGFSLGFCIGFLETSI